MLLSKSHACMHGQKVNPEAQSPGFPMARRWNWKAGQRGGGVPHAKPPFRVQAPLLVSFPPPCWGAPWPGRLQGPTAQAGGLKRERDRGQAMAGSRRS